MYVFFLGVVPFVSLFLFFVYYWRQNRPAFMRKSANVYVSNNFHADCLGGRIGKTSVCRGGSGGGTGAKRFKRSVPRPPLPSSPTATGKAMLLTIGQSRLISSTNPNVVCDSREMVFTNNSTA